MMNKNVRIAKELVKLAKSLVTAGWWDGEQFPEPRSDEPMNPADDPMSPSGDCYNEWARDLAQSYINRIEKAIKSYCEEEIEEVEEIDKDTEFGYLYNWNDYQIESVANIETDDYSCKISDKSGKEIVKFTVDDLGLWDDEIDNTKLNECTRKILKTLVNLDDKDEK